MIFDWVVLVLAISLVLYVLLGGADFGAGILEMFAPKQQLQDTRELTYQALGPVWEANHMWLILAIVILFNGFPGSYAALSTYLHIPLMLMLTGIVFRGTTFVFRHYDTIKDESHRYYSTLFVWSSFLTPFFLGVIAGAAILGKVNSEPYSFYNGYIAPWLNVFSFAVGIFTCAISAFLAAVFLIGESKSHPALQQHFRKSAIVSNILVILSGLLVFICAEWQGLPLFGIFLEHPLSIVGVLIATALVPLLWRHIMAANPWRSRLYAGGQVTAVLLAWMIAQYPVILRLSNGAHLTFQNSSAPEATLTVLGGSLFVGVLLIFPALFYLLRVFKFRETE